MPVLHFLKFEFLVIFRRGQHFIGFKIAVEYSCLIIVCACAESATSTPMKRVLLHFSVHWYAVCLRAFAIFFAFPDFQHNDFVRLSTNLTKIRAVNRYLMCF